MSNPHRIAGPIAAAVAIMVLPAVAPAMASPFGTRDLAAAQRGYAIYAQVCSACHSMREVTYGDLQGLGLSPSQVRALAAAVSVRDGIGADNRTKRRPARPDDHLPVPFASDEAAARANNGAVPPDMSRLAMTIEGKSRTITAILDGYADAPAGTVVPAGAYFNRAVPGHLIAMPPPLQDGAVSFDGNRTESVGQMASDAAAFLDWAAHPHRAARTRVGVGVLLYLALLAVLAFLLKRRIWLNAHREH